MVGADAYADKDAAYYAGERRDLIDRLTPDSTRSILEIGCGSGAAGAYARASAKCGRYVGVELSPDAGREAEAALDQVLVGDIERMELPFEPASFDVLIASEVLEHLVDPWRVLRELRVFLKPGATVFASSPNVAHKSTLTMLLRGRWDLTSDGRMDRTHLRWFTPATYAEMFTQSGYRVVSTTPVPKLSRRANFFNGLTGGRWSHLFVGQIVVEAVVSLAQPPNLGR